MRIFSTLRAQFVAVVAVAVILSNFGVVYIFEAARESELNDVRLSAVLDRISDTIDFMASIPVSQREAALRALTRQRFQYSIVPASPFADHVMSSEENQIARDLANGERAVRPGQIHVRVVPGLMTEAPTESPNPVDMGRLAPPAIEIAQPLDPQNWLLAHYERQQVPPVAPEVLIAAGLGTLLTCAAAAWLAGRVSRPITALARAADEVARGRTAPRLNVKGPDDLRRAGEAFNEMSDRVTRTLDSHRQLLSAVGHDLRTPLAAMRITAEFVQDGDVRLRLTRNLDELQSLTEAVLSAARAAPGEKARRIDLAALAQSVCDDLVDLQLPVDVTVEGTAPTNCRPNEIRRALRNLIENAVRYGGAATVVLDTEADFFAIRIEDNGPGIPEKRLEDVFQPFVRLESSRSSATGGAGLGLTLARTIAREHGGDVILENRQDEFGRVSGLKAILRLPREHVGRRDGQRSAAWTVVAAEPAAS